MKEHAITDLSIHKSADDYTPRLGQEVTWTITVSNDGKSAADNVRVNELLPEGMEFVSGHASLGDFDLSQGLWSVGSLAVGEQATAAITMVVMEVDDYINNYATVSTDTHDCNPSNDTNTVALDPWEPTSADLSLVKAVNNPSPKVGEVVEWTFSVTNSGPDTAWHTQVNESLPDGLTFLGARASEGAYDFQSGVWNVGHLADGESAEMVISTRVESDAGMQYVNTAAASSNTVDEDQSNNNAEASITVAEPTPSESNGSTADTGSDTGGNMSSDDDQNDDDKGGRGGKGKNDDRDDHGMHHHGQSGYGEGATCVACLCDCKDMQESGADLQIVKLVSNPTPNLNSEVVWTIVVTNNGPEDAENVTVNDNLPGGVEYVSDTTTMGAFDEPAGLWEIGDLASGESAMLQITSIATDAAAVQTNIALVSSDTEDSNPANNVATESIDAVDADLAITKTVDESAPDLGDEVVWTIEVVNNGPDTAENVVVADALPEGTTFVSSSNEDFNPATGELALGDLAPGDVFSIDITVTVDDADGARTNTAAVSSDTFDSNPDNNQDDAVVDAVAADLELNKEVLPETAAPGDIVEWTVSVTNNGPDAATGVQVEDILPQGVVYVSHTADETEFDAQSGLWAIGELAVGETALLTISAEVTDTGELLNIAQVSASDQFDPDSEVNNDDGDQSEDDEDNALLTVPEIIDLELTQEILADGNTPADSADVGDTVTYVITVENVSTVLATGVSVSTQLADHFDNGDLSFSSATQGLDFDPATGELIIGDLAPGASITLAVDAVVNLPGTLENIAEVATADQEDVDSTPGNDDPQEDDQDVVSLDVIDPNPVPVALNDQKEVQLSGELANAVIMVDHSGSMGSDTAGDQNPSGFTNDVVGLDGEITSRLEVVRDAIEQFAAREEVGSVKILGFDGSAGPISDDIPVPFDNFYTSMPHDNVSPWFDVSGPGNSVELRSFLDALRASGFTNYGEALELSQEFFDQDVNGNPETVPDGPLNYYFFTDGRPLSDSGSPVPDAAALASWEEFVENNFDEAYGIAFGGGATPENLLNVDLVSHRDDADETRFVNLSEEGFADNRGEENTIATNDVRDIPSILFKTIAASQQGNVFENDSIGDDGQQDSNFSVEQIIVDGITYQASATILDVETSAGGFLEFDFSDGSYIYFAPFVESQITETFEYSIVDGSGDSAFAELAVTVVPPLSNINIAATDNEDIVSLLVANDDELFTSSTIGDLKLVDSAENEWASDGIYSQDEMVDLYSFMV